jgi:hypothetical protein
MGEKYKINIDSSLRDENKFRVEIINHNTDLVYNLDEIFDSIDDALEAISDCIKMINA